jgi:hypothetical protein
LFSPRLRQVLEELRAMRRADHSRDLSTHIEAILSQEWPSEESYTLRLELIGELHLHNRNREAEAMLHAEVEREPLEPFHSLLLAEHFHYYDVNLQRSLHYVAHAVSKAKSDGKFMYQALGVQARLAIATQQWPLLDATLQRLAEYEHTPGNADVFPETDFLPRIPLGAVSPQVIASYVERVEHLRSIGYSTLYGARRVSS